MTYGHVKAIRGLCIQLLNDSAVEVAALSTPQMIDLVFNWMGRHVSGMVDRVDSS